jgi:electron transport complex protein RnfE
MSNSYARITRDGLWDNNIVFAQILGMCPTMAVTSSATNGLGMGLATTAVLVAANALVSSARNLISPDVRIPVYIALIVANCAVLGRAEAFAAKASVGHAAMDGLMMGLGFTFALTLIGGIREVIGGGTLFANAHLLLGPAFAFLETTVIPHYRGYLLFILPPGGFLVLGFLIAGKRIVDTRLAERPSTAALPEPAAG